MCNFLFQFTKIFFIRIGFRQDGIQLTEAGKSINIKKVAIACATATFTSVEFYLSLTLPELEDWVQEIAEQSEQKSPTQTAYSK